MKQQPTHIRTRWAALGAAVAVTLGASGGLGIARAAVDGDRARNVFVPIEPCRMVDTRPDSQVGPWSDKIGPGESRTITAVGSSGACDLPADANGVVANVTGLNVTAPTFMTLYPDVSSDPPEASNLNLRPNQPPVPNLANVTLNQVGQFAIYNAFGEADFIVDIAGYYADHTHEAQYRTYADADEASQGFVGDDPVSIATVTVPRSGPGHVVVNWSLNVIDANEGDRVRCSASRNEIAHSDDHLQQWASAGGSAGNGNLAGTRASFHANADNEAVTYHLVCDHEGASGPGAFNRASLNAVFIPDPDTMPFEP